MASSSGLFSPLSKWLFSQASVRTRALSLPAMSTGFVIAASLGEGACLVRAEHVHRPQVVDGGQTLDDHLLTRQTDSAARERDGHDHRQQFRGEPNSQSQGKDQRLKPGPME